MAFINENPLFSINGKVGKYVIRKFNGQKVISERPAHYKKTSSRSALENQNRFSIASRFAKHINSNSVLAAIWKGSNVKGFSPYHKIIKVNVKHITKNGLSNSNIIVPNSSHNLITDVSFDGSALICYLETRPSYNRITFQQGKQIQTIPLYFFSLFSFSFSSGYENQLIDMKLVDRISDLDTNSFVSPLQFTLNEDILKQIGHSNKCMIFTTFVWKSNNKLLWNVSYSKILKPSEKNITG